MSEKYNLSSEFDLEKHKENFTNYLEVIIDERGKVFYAVPSHQEFLIKRCCDKLKVSREVLDLMCPKEFHSDFMIWLSKMCNCVAVWNDFTQGYEYTEEQVGTIQELKDGGVYFGDVPKVGKYYRNREVSKILNYIMSFSIKKESMSFEDIAYLLKQILSKDETMCVEKISAYRNSCECPVCHQSHVFDFKGEEFYCSKCGQLLWARPLTREEIHQSCFDNEMDDYED